MSDELKNLLQEQGKTFEAFKETLAEEQKKADAVTSEKLTKIEASLDAAVEGKAKLEARIEAERKEREDLELRLSRMGNVQGDGKKALEIQELKTVLSAHQSARNKTLGEFGEAEFDAYKAAFQRQLREGKEALTADEVKTLSVGSDPDGGYFVTPDTSGRIVNKIYETSPARQISAQ